MVRTVKGITLSPEERIQAGYDLQKTQSHTCTTCLPNGVACDVFYARTSARVHVFSFGVPLRRTQHVYEAIPDGVPGIEAKARALAEALFDQAQHQEQRDMRQKAPAGRTARRSDSGPQIGAKIAAELAGRYAACVRHGSGNLIRVGGTYQTPEKPLKEIGDGRYGAIRLINGQQLVVGICNRAAQRWEEPMFLKGDTSLLASQVSGTETAHDPAEDLEDEEEPNIALGNREDDVPPEETEGEG